MSINRITESCVLHSAAAVQFSNKSFDWIPLQLMDLIPAEIQILIFEHFRS